MEMKSHPPDVVLLMSEGWGVTAFGLRKAHLEVDPPSVPASCLVILLGDFSPQRIEAIPPTIVLSASHAES